MTEDEDVLNILLWRYRKHKQWCKWDPMPNQYINYLDQDAVGNGFNMQLHDTVWYPYVPIAQHGTVRQTAVCPACLRVLEQMVGGAIIASVPLSRTPHHRTDPLVEVLT